VSATLQSQAIQIANWLIAVGQSLAAQREDRVVELEAAIHDRSVKLSEALSRI
jgi:hypothetical protein